MDQQLTFYVFLPIFYSKNIQQKFNVFTRCKFYVFYQLQVLRFLPTPLKFFIV